MDNIEIFFERMKNEMAKQTEDIISKLDKKLAPLTREVEELRLENQELEEKIKLMERSFPRGCDGGKRNNNIIIYGLKETEKTKLELIELTVKKLGTDLKIFLENNDINEIRRIGKKS
ncbi:unnamed protein product [Parnassius apollo]|uniref:(apollo) hypothetical protein n=1 Tax=Parnassius apollo TaxID=110799 RepID=A0A8S3XUK4_PARAO|nr:unnamed protein product [Parnassius apollo]